jgi:tRNA1Val (adenine37-N6)-methyltransferase
MVGGSAGLFPRCGCKVNQQEQPNITPAAGWGWYRYLPERFNLARFIDLEYTSQDMRKTEKNQEAVKDTLFEGALVCWQHAGGYRYSIDSVILAHLTRVRPGDTVLDLGTGTGVLGLILLYRNRAKGINLIGVEKQDGLFALAERNVLENDLDTSFKLFKHDVQDIQEIIAPESCDVVVANPPYYPPGSGRQNQAPEVLRARHQDPQSLEQFISAAAYGVKNRGRVWFVYPAHNVSELLLSLHRFHLEPKTLQPIYSRPSAADDAKLVVVEALKNGGVGLAVRSPFYIYLDGRDIYSAEMQAMYNPERD